MRAPEHHPPEDRLLAYVSGQLDTGERLLLEVHLGVCDHCAHDVSKLAGPGGLGLKSRAISRSPADLLERIEARLDRLDNRKALPTFRVGGEALPIPASLATELVQMKGADSLKWHGLLKKGIRYLTLMEDRAKDAAVYLVHLKAGSAFPGHAHLGLEQAVVLSGGTQDHRVQLEAGDYQENPAGTKHQPMALPDEDCWLLTRVAGGTLAFDGWRGWVQKF